MRSLLIITFVLMLTLSACSDVMETSEKVNLQNELQEEFIFADNANYILDLDRSELKWSASKIVSNYHEGSVDIIRGNLMMESADLNGEFVIDLNTIIDENSNPRLIDHLKGEDFFNVEMYPTSRFVITNLEKIGSDYLLTGELTIIGNTDELSFKTSFFQADGGVNAKASFEIDRTKWGLNYQSGSILEQLGEKAIKDEVKFDLDLFFIEE